MATIVNSLGQEINIAQDEVSVHADDSLALVAYYYATQGDKWIHGQNAGWLVDPVAFWPGVNRIDNVGTEESPEWRVTRFNQMEHSMVAPGHLPPEIGKMTHIQRFETNRNTISGSIPPEVADMEQLRFWTLTTNMFTGEFPFEYFKDLQYLERISIRSNFYSGSIPAIIGEFPSLTRLDVGRQHMSGELPQELGNIATLNELWVGTSNFTGDIPDLGNLEHLSNVEFQNNQFNSGPFPEWIRDGHFSENNVTLRLDNTNRTEVPSWITEVGIRRLGFGEKPGIMTGPLPDLSFMENLDYLWIMGGDFDGLPGPMPDWLGEMPSLRRLYIKDVAFNGPIPANLAANTLERFELHRLHLMTGGLPSQLTGSPGLTQLKLIDMPGLEIGPIPSWFDQLTSLRRLHLVNVGITGNLPEFMKEMTLQQIVLNDNAITGPIPDITQWTAELGTIERIEFGRTLLEVNEIPSWVCDLWNLYALNLAGLGIQGEIPACLGDLVFLAQIALDDNDISGSIPASLGNLAFLDTLNLANNNLSGPIPERLAEGGGTHPDNRAVNAMVFSGNENLEGELPMAFTDQTYMRVFEYENTKLCAPNDPLFTDWLTNTIPGNRDVSRRENIYDDMHTVKWVLPNYTSVKDNEEYCSQFVSAGPPERVHTFVLEQNYPNPFNPATTIRYSIPVEGHVTLSVYNVLGQHVATLVDDVQNSGSHQVSFDGSRLASGHYVYRLVAGEYVQSHSMMLIK